MPPEINFYNPRSLLLFVCLLQGVVFAGLLFIRSKRRKNQSDFLLGILLLVMCSGLITHFIGFANVYNNNQWLTFFPFELVFAHAPVIYLYVQTLTNENRRLGLADLKLFLPTLGYWVYFFILFWQDAEFKEWYGNTGFHFGVQSLITVGLFGWNLVLLYLSIKHYRQYRVWLDANYSDTELIKFNWLKAFLYIFAVIFLLESVFDIAGAFYDFSYIQAFYLKLVIALATYYLAIAGYLRSRSIEVGFAPAGSAPEEDQTRRDLLLAGDELESSKSRLIRLMETEKPYLDAQLTLKDLSRKLGMNTSVLSHLINRGFGKNFNEFINEYRIEKVKKILRSRPAGDETFLNIAFDSGFNSKATFNRSFKKFTGVSPKEFLEYVSGEQ